MDTTQSGLIDLDTDTLAHIVLYGSTVPVTGIASGQPQSLETLVRHRVGDILGSRQCRSNQIETRIEIVGLDR